MQIDFHHAVTYVAARTAGFAHEEADIVSYAAQYVDDAVSSGVVRFDNDAIATQISSSHKSFDAENLNNQENILVWLPYHFLPGNGGKPAGQSPEGTFIQKLVCTPDSPIANEMVRACILDCNKPYGLHRLGVTMHVYADTWAHQGFAGVLHEINEINDLEETAGTRVLDSIFERLASKTAPPIGHGRALSLPDMPFLSWKYRNGRGMPVSRNNTDLFCDAAESMCQAMQRFRCQNPDAAVPGLAVEDRQTIRAMLTNLTQEDGAERHRHWIEAVRTGAFTFGRAEIAYSETAWENVALQEPAASAAAAAGGGVDSFKIPGWPNVYHYTDSFLQSNWRLFQDAVQLHRFTIGRDILPKYGICSG